MSFENVLVMVALRQYYSHVQSYVAFKYTINALLGVMTNDKKEPLQGWSGKNKNQN
jgi:hypothetical protein